MVICPKLLREQFDAEGNAQIWLRFAQKEFHVTYKNPLKLSYGEYAIQKASCDGQTQLTVSGLSAFLGRETIASLSDTVHEIEIELGRS